MKHCLKTQGEKTEGRREEGEEGEEVEEEEEEEEEGGRGREGSVEEGESKGRRELSPHLTLKKGQE